MTGETTSPRRWITTFATASDMERSSPDTHQRKTPLRGAVVENRSSSPITIPA
eukprot:CAMPEP_0181338900 /NCGR_PEP_ID=MMETSP1101-20121128/28913_1 /TAXON_ID=46948 /ORGANISM="Rhodomonas abbreviata, Strain Caron Lab Isolate" /LENGTH=52 /DNA_ID=CAMNT_0023449721 /DNA_START=147 /DNA_END=305 /DNA_ORIENTATION=-